MIKLDEVRLDIQTLAASTCVAEDAWANGIETEVFHMAAERLVQMMAYTRVASQALDSTEHLWPSTWWQALKERFFPVWLLRRFPVERTTVRMDARAYYADLAIPDGRHYIAISKVVVPPLSEWIDCEDDE